MILDARRGVPDCCYRVFDASTGREIPKVFWCNTETNELERWDMDEHGAAIMEVVEAYPSDNFRRYTKQIKVVREVRPFRLEKMEPKA